MIRARLGVALLALALAGAATAQQSPPAQVGDVPAGDGTLTGRVHNAAGAGVPLVEVVLYAVADDGRPGVRRTLSDAEGGFRFDAISSDPTTAYLLGARYQDVPFPGSRVSFAAGQSTQQADIVVAEVTREPRGVEVDEVRLRLDYVGVDLTVAETHHIRNGGERVIFVPPAERAGATAAFRATLPDGAQNYTLPYSLPPEGLVRDGADVRYWGPIYLGDQEVSFTYTLPAKTIESALRHRFPSGAGRVVVLARKGRVELTGALTEGGWQAGPDEDLDGRSYTRRERGAVRRGGSIELALAGAETREDPAAVRPTYARLFLELDDAALLVSEEHHFEVSGDIAVVGRDAPLARIAVPEGATDISFSGRTLDLGVTVESGVLGIRGPMPPGDVPVELRYRLAADENGIDFARRFDERVPVVEVFLPDTGVAVETDMLHRLRPVRSDDRTWMHFEAFHVPAGETLTLRLRPLPVRGGLSRTTAMVFVAGTAALALLFLGGPLRGRMHEAAAEPEESDARREFDALATSLEDLEHDHETGKISDDDYTLLRRDLRARAMDALRRDREDVAETPAADAGPKNCAGCGAEVAADARFCSQCGRAVAETNPPEAGA